MSAYKESNRKSIPIIEPLPAGLEGLSAALLLERDARAFGKPELTRIAEKIKDAHGRLLRGECVPPNELGELIAFVRCNTEPAVAEVCGA
jgi:hypothetical protein